MKTKHTIQKKFLHGYLLIFSISLIFLNVAINNILNQNTENIIKSDMENLQKYSKAYIKQYLLLNNFSDDVFVKSGGTLAQELSQNLQSNVSLYHQDKFLFEALGENNEYIIVNSKPSEILQKSSKKDLYLAEQNKAAYTVNKIEDQYIINFSYPLYFDGSLYGIVRFTKNYTTSFQANLHVLTSLTLFTLILFMIIFAFSYVLSKRITKPIVEVTKAFNEVASGNYETTLEIRTGDEIEELTERFHDMKKQIKEQLTTIQAEKEKVEKVERSRREFFNNVTHELKTPLTTISGYAQILSEDGFHDSEFLAKAASRIRTESDRLHQMVVEVIELSKQHSMNSEKFNLSEVVVQLCDDLQLKASRYNIYISYRITPEDVYGLKSKLIEVIINLLDNAIKYGDHHSTIHVSVTKADNCVTFEVSNQCRDFNENILPNLFEPYYRGSKSTRDEKGSMGLGLYICKQIIEEHKGTISVQANNGIVILKVNLPIWQ